MLFFVVAIVLVAAANAVHNTTVQEVNALIDHTIKKIITHDHYTVHYLLITAEVTNVQHLKRTGDCVKTAAPFTFECHAADPDVTFKALGGQIALTVNINFSVVANAEGQLVKFNVLHVDAVRNAHFAEYYLDLNALWEQLKAAIMRLLFGVVEEKTAEVQKEVGLTVFGTYINQ